MTNDERKLLEDRIYEYGSGCRAGIVEEDAAWSKLMDEITKIQKREEKNE